MTKTLPLTSFYLSSCRCLLLSSFFLGLYFLWDWIDRVRLLAPDKLPVLFIFTSQHAFSHPTSRFDFYTQPTPFDICFAFDTHCRLRILRCLFILISPGLLWMLSFQVFPLLIAAELRLLEKYFEDISSINRVLISSLFLITSSPFKNCKYLHLF